MGRGIRTRREVKEDLAALMAEAVGDGLQASEKIDIRNAPDPRAQRGFSWLRHDDEVTGGRVAAGATAQTRHLIRVRYARALDRSVGITESRKKADDDIKAIRDALFGQSTHRHKNMAFTLWRAEEVRQTKAGWVYFDISFTVLTLSVLGEAA